MQLKEYQVSNGEKLLYSGNPDFELLKELTAGPGDLWHSSLNQGFQDIFPELVYQTAVFWWYLNDLPELRQSVNWRINSHCFVIREKVWNFFEGFSEDYQSDFTKGLDLGYRMLRFGGAVPLFVEGLFPNENHSPFIPGEDRYLFYLKNFKDRHSWYMYFRASLTAPIKEYKFFKSAKSKILNEQKFLLFPSRPLNELKGMPLVDVIIPTMSRQNFTIQLLEDYKKQSFKPRRVIVVDATPKEERDESLYQDLEYPFELVIKWQQSNGSCRARNEAIDLCKGEYIIFADDDTRILPDFVENHLRFLQTYKVDACTGLDIHASNHRQNLDDLREFLKKLGQNRFIAGAAQTFNNANACVKRVRVEEVTGNDINFDGGYGEDTDFGIRLIKKGVILMANPYSVNLHLKPPAGGYRDWGIQSSITGSKRKRQPWELDKPIGKIRPIPSPTIVYGILKHFRTEQVKEYKKRYLFLYLSKSLKKFPLRLLNLPLKVLQFNKAMFYAQKLIKKGERF